MRSSRRKNQKPKNHPKMPSKDFHASSRKEPLIKTILSRMSLNDHLLLQVENSTSKESHWINISSSTTAEDLMMSYRKSQKSNTLSQKAKALLTNSLASSSEALPIKTIQQLKSMKDH